MSNETEFWKSPSPGESVILVVDDLPANIQVVGSILRSAGYQVVPASNGETALRYAQKKGLHLILLDLMMPGMDGFEVCRRLKANPATQSIPIIFLTAAHESDQIVQGLELGAADYVTKPFNASELLARVRTHVELKLIRSRLEGTVEQLNELDREKNEFLGIAAHDLKNPVCSFIGIAQYLLAKSSMQPAETHDLARDLLKESRRLLSLIQNLLDVNAIERGCLKVELVSCDLSSVAAGVIHQSQGKAGAKLQTISMVGGEGPATVRADTSLLTQVLDNLVSNAMKFSAPGSPVTLHVTAVGQAWECAVVDQGPGLSLGDQARLFGKFARLTARPTGGESSNGLGLSIVKRLMEAMGGSVRCESELGRGSRFIISLPRLGSGG